jgi:hypothetical protein
MDCQKIIMYGLLLLAAVYVLRDVFNLKFKIPLLEGQAGAAMQPDRPAAAAAAAAAASAADSAADSAAASAAANDAANAAPPAGAGDFAPTPPTDQLPSGGPTGPVASEASDNETFLPVEGIRSAPSSCYPQNTLTPKDLLPQGKEEEIEQWDENNPAQEGILKGVNFLDAGFHVGVNTVGQSLRNANRNLRAEPPNPRVQVSPWMNTTIDEDLMRRPLGTEGVCNQASPEHGLVQ